jgi:cell division protein FtsL
MFGLEDELHDEIRDLKKTISIQQELINVLQNQVVDLTMMSKIELGDDVIKEINRLKSLLKQDN